MEIILSTNKYIIRLMWVHTIMSFYKKIICEICKPF